MCKLTTAKNIRIITKQKADEARERAEQLKQAINMSRGNSKLQATIIFNLPAVITCPWATESCLNYCYTLKAERQYPSVLPRRVRHLLESQKTDFVKNMNESLSKLKQVKTRNKERKFHHVRIHESGDFYSQSYVDKWVEIVKSNPDLHFLAYTKSYALDFTELSKLPNMTLRYSLDSTSKQVRADLPLAYVRTEETLEKLPQAGDKRQTIQCQADWKCADCRLCWTSNKDVSFQLH